MPNTDRDLTPSNGEFRGSYNINLKDFRNVSTLNPDRHLLQTHRKLPHLAKAEAKAVVARVKTVLRAHLITIINAEMKTEFYWPEQVCSIPEIPVDRTVTLELASVEIIDGKLLSDFMSLLQSQLRLWRILIRIPYGDEADITIYPGCCRLGDGFYDSPESLDSAIRAWRQAEMRDAPRRSKQISSVVDAKPLLMTPESEKVFIHSVLEGSFVIPESIDHPFTAWIGTIGQPFGLSLPTIKSVDANDEPCEFGYTTLFGYFDVATRFQLCDWRKASVQIKPFQLTRIASPLLVAVEFSDFSGNNTVVFRVNQN